MARIVTGLSVLLLCAFLGSAHGFRTQKDLSKGHSDHSRALLASSGVNGSDLVDYGASYFQPVGGINYTLLASEILSVFQKRYPANVSIIVCNKAAGCNLKFSPYSAALRTDSVTDFAIFILNGFANLTIYANASGDSFNYTGCSSASRDGQTIQFRPYADINQCVPPKPPGGSCTSDYPIQYTVGPKDSLRYVATECGLSTPNFDGLKKIFNGQELNKWYLGPLASGTDKFCLPSQCSSLMDAQAPAPAQAPSPLRTSSLQGGNCAGQYPVAYNVQRGDTVTSLARACGTNASYMFSDYDLVTTDISIGDKLCFPSVCTKLTLTKGQSSQSSGGCNGRYPVTYYLQQGDTVSSLVSRCGYQKASDLFSGMELDQWSASKPAAGDKYCLPSGCSALLSPASQPAMSPVQSVPSPSLAIGGL